MTKRREKAISEIKWREIPTFEKLQQEFTLTKAEEIKDFVDTKAYNAWTVNGRINFVNTYNYILYLEMLADKIQQEFTPKFPAPKDVSSDIIWCGQLIGVKVDVGNIVRNCYYAIFSVSEERRVILHWWGRKVYGGDVVMCEYDAIPNKEQYTVYQMIDLAEIMTPFNRKRGDGGNSSEVDNLNTKIYKEDK